MELPFSDPVLIFATVMVLILLSPILARRLRIPEIVALILAGMIVGPHGLGWLARDDTIELLGHVGLLFIMFICGLEIDLHRASRQRSHSITFGLLTFSIPLGLGTVMGVLWLRMSVTASLLMASMFASHTLLTVPIIGRLGLAKSRSVTTTIGGTIITDTLALLLLAVVAAELAGDLSPLFWVVLAVKIVVYMAGVLIVAPIIARWFLRNFSTDENIEFVSVLAITFAASYLAHVAGLEPIIGAFLVGLCLNSLIPEKSGLMAKIHFTGNALFVPFFLLSVGMLVDLGLLWNGVETWKTVAGMTGVALLAKWLAAVLFGKLLRYAPDEAGLIFGLSVNQAAATLAAAMVGYRIGLFDDGIITGTIIMIGITCMVGPVVTEKFGRRLAVKAEHALEAPTVVPRRILLPIHVKENAQQILDLVFFLRGESSHEPLYPMNVALEGPRADLEIAHGENLIAHTVIRSLSANVPVNPLTVVDVNVPSGILRAARENRISIIAMSWDGRVSYGARVFGSIIDRVVSDSTQMVLVNRIVHKVSTAKRVLLLCPPFIGLQPGFPDALMAVKSIVKQGGAKLVLLTTGESAPVLERYARKIKPAVPVTCRSYAQWKSVLEEVAEELQADDWIFTVEARIGEIAWQPSSDRLPRQMARKWPDHNLSFIYPPEERGGRVERAEAKQAEPQDRLSRILGPDVCRLGIDTHDLRELLEALLIPVLRDERGCAERTLRSLCAIAAREPVELEPGVVLLHDHSACVTQPEIYLATSREPLHLATVSVPLQVVIVLLDPVGQDPARHLAALSRVAGLMKIPGFAEQAKQAVSYEDLARRLAG